MVKPEFFTNAKMRSLSFGKRLLYLGLWLLTDDDGRFEADPQVIKGALFPTDNMNVEKGLRKFIELGMIECEEIEGVPVCTIKSWKKHQVIKYPRARTLPLRDPRFEKHPSAKLNETKLNKTKRTDKEVLEGAEKGQPEIEMEWQAAEVRLKELSSTLDLYGLVKSVAQRIGGCKVGSKSAAQAVGRNDEHGFQKAGA
jgi:NACalpha-BTF3-like transcription factor